MTQEGWATGTAHAADGSRHYRLWVPATPNERKPSPLVMMLHGCTHDAEQTAEISGMNDVAEVNGFLVVYPEQSRLANLMKCWNWFAEKNQSRDAGEPSILAAVIDKVRSRHHVDGDRIYVVGVSAGGAMASILGATYPDLFAAIGVFAGVEFKAATSVATGLAAMKHGGPDPVRQGQFAFDAMRGGLTQTKRRRMPVIVFHGTADTTVNPVNADQVIVQWGKTNACLATRSADSEFAFSERVIGVEVPGGYAFRRYIYTDQAGCLLMEKWLVQGLGHAWSGSPKASKYGDLKGPNASAEIWRFFCQACSPFEACLLPPPLHQESREKDE
jgi:poly(hydroxyalkanoate) depolymerase family esterase